LSNITPVNRRVVGSSPTWGATRSPENKRSGLFAILPEEGKNRKKEPRLGFNRGSAVHVLPDQVFDILGDVLLAFQIPEKFFIFRLSHVKWDFLPPDVLPGIFHIILGFSFLFIQ